MAELELEKLANELFETIKNNESDFFKTKLVIVPSIKMEAYLKTFYLKKYDTVLMNISFKTFNKGFLELFDTDLKLADKNQIRSLIIKYLVNKTIPEFSEYLNKDSNDYYVKLLNIANELVSLFDEYEKDYKTESLIEYQKTIYNYVIGELKKQKLTTLCNLYNECQFKSSDLIYVFGSIKYSKLEQKILNKYKNYEEFKVSTSLEKGSKLDIVKAPSKLREIEYLHSKICDLTNGTDVAFSDFLVVGTGMSEYEEIIARVFNQDNENYPNIPYYVNASKTNSNNVWNALNTLKEILYKGFYSRLDFDNLITNRAIKYVRGITDKDIQNWRDAVMDMNVYRKEDWDYAKKRLLTSKICDINGSDNVVNIQDKNYISYSSIGLDDASIVRFINMVDDLNNLIEAFSKSNVTSEDSIKDLEVALDAFLSIKDENGTETNGYYKKLFDTYNFWIENKLDGIPTKTLLEVLVDVSKRSVVNKGQIYTSGITFTEFDKNTILSSKYLFFINANSNNLPIKKTKNSLDLDKPIDYIDEQNAFNAYYNNAEKVFVSYVSRDLKTDEEFFLSNFVKELTDSKIADIKAKDKKDNLFDEKNIDGISIDEDGSIENIYTNRSEKNTQFRDFLLNGGAGSSSVTAVSGNQNKNFIVTVNQIGDFLAEPLKSKLSRQFNVSDETIDKLTREYEPFELNSLDKSNYFKKITVEMLKSTNESDTKDDLKKAFDLRKQIPNITKNIEEKIYEDLFNQYEIFKKYIGTTAKVTKLPDLILVDPATHDEWTIVNNNEFVMILNVGEMERTYIPIKDIEKVSYVDMLRMYVLSLMDIASKNDANEYSIILCANSEKEKKYKLESKEAKEILIEILNSFSDFKNNYFYDYEYLENYKSSDDKKKKKYYEVREDYNVLIKNIRESNGIWGYFDDKKLVSYDSDLGYDEEAYYNDVTDVSQLDEKTDLQLKLMKKLFVGESEVDGDESGDI